MLLIEIIQEWLMLVADQVNISISQGLVRRNVVGKFDDFDVNPLFFCFLSHGFDDFSMRTRCGSDLDFLVAAAGTLAIIPLTAATGKADSQYD